MQEKKTARSLEKVAENLERLQEILDDSSFDADEFTSGIEELKTSLAQISGLPSAKSTIMNLPQTLEKNLPKFNSEPMRKKFSGILQDATEEVDDVLMDMRNDSDESEDEAIPLLVGKKIS